MVYQVFLYINYANKLAGFELSEGFYLTKAWFSFENVVKV